MTRQRRSEFPVSRRRALKRLSALAPALLLARCAQEPSLPPEIRVPLAALPAEGRARHFLGSVPVEIFFEEGQPRARSLLCTHQGCEVSWLPDVQRYRCPCHEAFFDAAGVPIEGPANEALRELPLTIEDGHVVVRPLE